MGILDGKIAIVTGGTKGIGLAISQCLFENGAKVIACSRNKNNLQNLNIDFFRLDVVNDSDIDGLVKYVISKYGKIDILVNNAGIMKDRTTKKMTDEEFNTVISTNLKGTFNLVRKIGPIMMEKKNGSIINISSFVAQQGNIGQANYVASKAAIEGMTKCWAKEFTLHGENIRVNCIAPGIVLTDIFSDTSVEILESLKNKIMLKRFAKPEEIAKCVLFLASNDSSYITGRIIPVDGGIRL